jgi:hypothetical protein
MRKAVLLGMVIALGAAGAAYAATSLTNQYIIKPFTVSPKKSGTKTHPVSIGTTVAYTVSTKPAGSRPAVIKSETITIQGVRANSNKFPTCSSSRLVDPTEGPSTCAKGSLVGTGFFKAEIGPSANPSAPGQLNCRVDLSVYNSGNNRETYYLYLKPGQAGECPPSNTLPTTMTAKLSETKSGNLVQTFTLPNNVRHPATGFDSTPTFATLTTKNATRKVKGKTVGALESISCPANHSRQLAIKFTLESGSSRTATRNTACS